LPDGHVLVQASPVTNANPFNTPSHFYEFDGANLTQVPDPPDNAAYVPSYYGRMLLLPSGEVLLTETSPRVLLYSNGGAPQEAEGASPPQDWWIRQHILDPARCSTASRKGLVRR
jgi:hypothetical protein